MCHKKICVRGQQSRYSLSELMLTVRDFINIRNTKMMLVTAVAVAWCEYGKRD